MLATVLEKVSNGEDVLDQYRYAVMRDDQSHEFAVRLARQGMEFGVMMWVLCEAKMKGSLDTKKATGADL